MNTQLKIFELVLAELIGEREINEMEINRILNDQIISVNIKKLTIRDTLKILSNINSEITLLTEYVQQIQKQVDTQNGEPVTTEEQNTGELDNNNNNNTH